MYEYKKFEPAKINELPMHIPQSTFENQDDLDGDADDNEDDDLNPRNFLSNLYQNDEYIKLKQNTEKQLIDAAKEEVERKKMIEDADKVLKDLQQWKQKRE